MPRPKVHWIRDARQLAAVRSPVRHQLLRTLSMLGTASVKELAGRIGKSPESLYYHVDALRDVGLVEEAGERGEGRHREMLYATPGRVLRTDPAQSSKSYLEAMMRSTSSLLRLADRQLQSELERQAKEKRPRHPAFRIEQHHARLDEESARRLRELLDQLAELLSGSDDPDGIPVSVTFACTPVSGRRGESGVNAP